LTPLESSLTDAPALIHGSVRGLHGNCIARVIAFEMTAGAPILSAPVRESPPKSAG